VALLALQSQETAGVSDIGAGLIRIEDLLRKPAIRVVIVRIQKADQRAGCLRHAGISRGRQALILGVMQKRDVESRA
jgi:hypothetical protein